MKKALLAGGLVLLGLAVVFTACQQPVGEEKTNKDQTTFVTLPAPENVNAEVYGSTGVIRVSWDPVPGAAAYDIYRRSVDYSTGGSGTVVKHVASVDDYSGTYGNFLVLDDVIAFDNTFRTGVDYTYKVVAAFDSANIGSQDWFKDSSFDVIIQNGSQNSNTVSFPSDGDNALLAQGSALAKPGNPKVNIYMAYDTVSPQEYVQMSWDTLPGVSYLVRYSYGAGEAAAYQPNSSDFVTMVDPLYTFGQTRYAWDFPLIGGKSTLQLIAQHESSSYGAAYYLPSEPVSEQVNAAKTLLDLPSGFDFEFEAAPTADKRVKITWNDFAGAAGYEVYRFTTTNPGGYEPGGYMFDNWENISSKINRELELKNDGGDPTRKWVGYDTAIGESHQSFTYMLIAKSEKGRSLPVIATGVQNYVNPEITAGAEVLGWDAAAQAYPVKLSWADIPGASCEIYRIAAAKYDASGITAFDGNYKLIAATTLPSPNPNNVELIAVINGGNAEFTDKPEVRKAHRYKVIAKVGTVSGESVFDLVEYPYMSGRVDVSASFNNTPAIAADAASRGTAYQIGYQLNDVPQLLALMKDTESVRISRAPPTDGPGNIPYTVIETIPKASVDGSRRVYNAGTGTYDYLAEVVSSDGKVLKNEDAHKVVPNVIPSFTEAGSITKTSGTAIRFEVTSGYKLEYIERTEFRISYIDILTANIGSAPTFLADAIDAGNAMKQTLYLNRNTSLDVNLYFTAAVPNDPAAGYTRYGKLQVRKADGTWADTIVAEWSNTSEGQF